jgi:hypothetical protein
MADAVVAIDAKTGRIEWSHTMFCDDSWDYDTVRAPMVLDVTRGGGTTRAVGSGSKAGYYAVLDAKTGKPISRSPYITRFSRPHLRPTRKGTVVCPGIFGGIEYGPAALDPTPDRESIFIAGNQWCQRYKLASRAEVETRAPGEDDLGGTVEQVGPATADLAALDPATGQLRLKVKLPSTSNGPRHQRRTRLRRRRRRLPTRLRAAHRQGPLALRPAPPHRLRPDRLRGRRRRVHRDRRGRLAGRSEGGCRRRARPALRLPPRRLNRAGAYLLAVAVAPA